VSQQTIETGGLTIELGSHDQSIIESVIIDETVLMDRIGDIRFGFFGFITEDPVTFMVFRSDTFFSYGFDDLRFAVVPSPGAAPLLAGACAFGVVRRRRR